MSNYIYKNDKISGFQFYKLPHALINNEDFKSLSNDSKLLYTLMLDRTSLSIKNHWFDSGGKVYINYPLTEVVEKLNIGLSKACKLMKELEQIGLIDRKRVGLCKPDIIYVKNMFKRDNPECEDAKLLFDDNEQSESGDNIYHDSLNEKSFPYNKTDETIPSESDQSNQSSERNEMNDYCSERDYYLNLMKENIEYDWFLKSYNLPKNDSGRPFGSIKNLDSIVNIIVDCICSTQKTIRVNGSNVPTEVVRSYFLSLNNDNIQNILNNLRDHAVDVNNIRAYITTMLYNEATTHNIADSIELNSIFR